MKKQVLPFYSYACFLFNKYNMEDSNASEIKKINPGSLTRPWTSVHAHLSNLLIYVCSTRAKYHHLPNVLHCFGYVIKTTYGPPMNNNQEYLEYTDTTYCWYNQDECKVLVQLVEKPWLI